MNERILVIEDDPDIRDSVAELLRFSGFDVICAENGAEGLRSLAEAAPPPDLVLLDLMMPVMDGWEFRARQLADVRFAHIPVVVLSAAPMMDERGRALAARAWVRKPFELDRLLAALR